MSWNDLENVGSSAEIPNVTEKQRQLILKLMRKWWVFNVKKTMNRAGFRSSNVQVIPEVTLNNIYTQWKSQREEYSRENIKEVSHEIRNARFGWWNVLKGRLQTNFWIKVLHLVWFTKCKRGLQMSGRSRGKSLVWHTIRIWCFHTFWNHEPEGTRTRWWSPINGLWFNTGIM